MATLEYKYCSDFKYDDYKEDLVRLVKAYVAHMPLFCGLEIDDEYNSTLAEYLREPWTNCSHVFFALDSDTGRAVAFIRMQPVFPKHDVSNHRSGSGLPEQMVRDGSVIKEFCKNLRSEANISLFGSETVIELYMIAVLPEYHNQGVATRLTDLALTKMKELGYQQVIVLVANAYSIKLMERFGFQCLAEKLFKDSIPESHYVRIIDSHIQKLGKVMLKQLN